MSAPDCRACDGCGEGIEFVPDRHSLGVDVHWICPTCDGSGVEPCAHCRTESVTIRDGDIALCADCADEWDAGMEEPVGGFTDTWREFIG